MAESSSAPTRVASSPVHYVRVRGRLWDDNRLSLRFDGPTQRPLASDGRPWLWAEVLDGPGRVLLRHALVQRRLEFLRIGGVPDVGSIWVHAHLPLPAQAQRIRFAREGVILQALDLPAKPPTLALVQSPPREVREAFPIAWKSEPGVRCRLLYSINDDSWLPISTWLTSTNVMLDPADLPGGPSCRLRLVATDGFRTADVTTMAFTVPIKPCTAVILSPLNGTRVSGHQPLLLRGQGWWLEEQRAETTSLRWHSSIDGPLGDGAIVRSPLSAGSHRITLVAGDGERAGKAVATVLVDGGCEPRG